MLLPSQQDLLRWQMLVLSLKLREVHVLDSGKQACLYNFKRKYLSDQQRHHGTLSCHTFMTCHVNPYTKCSVPAMRSFAPIFTIEQPSCLAAFRVASWLIDRSKVFLGFRYAFDSSMEFGKNLFINFLQ